MGRFLNLFHASCAEFPTRHHWLTRRKFPGFIAQSHDLFWWTGRREAQRLLILGVATWSRYDMELLDELELSLQHCSDPPCIEVFDVADCQSQEDFQILAPGIGPVLMPPVAAYYCNGVLVSSGSGPVDGRNLVRSLVPPG